MNIFKRLADMETRIVILEVDIEENYQELYQKKFKYGDKVEWCGYINNLYKGRVLDHKWNSTHLSYLIDTGNNTLWKKEYELTKAK